MKAEISLYLDTRRTLKKGNFPLKLHVYFTAKVEKWFPLDYKLTKEEFEDSYLAIRPRGDAKDLKIELEEIVKKGQAIAKDLGDFFTMDKFEQKMFRAKANITNVIEHFEAYRKILIASEQIGTASSYNCAINSIKAFFNDGKKHPITHLAFSALTPDVLNKYEKWMTDQDNSKTTVGIYMRNLRAIFNLAIKAGDIRPELYPFKIYKIPNGKNIKKALENNHLKELFSSKIAPGSAMEKARNFWFFSYQCNGMNFRDISELKFKNLHDSYFSFIRHKTINTTKEDPIPIVVPITPYVREFFAKYGNKNGKPNDYVFPIFYPGISAIERHRVNQNFIRFVNQHMKKLVSNSGLEIKARTMEARHTFTTKATRKMGLEFAQEALGHTSMATTQNYWAGFESETKIEVANMLMDFSESNAKKKRPAARIKNQ
jgi:integrase